MRLPGLTLSILIAALAAIAQNQPVRSGIEVLRDRGFDILQNKRVGLITNQTAVDSRLASTVDILHRAEGVTLVALFGPEHGVRGDYAAGDKVESGTDARTGLPAFSLYGKTQRPTKEMLAGIDVLVYDIQDIGCRSYTYISTMGLAMEAAAENGIPFVVLDRPNPLGGIRIEGNNAEPGFFSLIGQFPIPYVYGLTSGELARLLNEEGMLRGGARCSLTVVPMSGWKRSMTFAQTGLPWVPTSPHVPQATTPPYYVATGVMGEIDGSMIGIGYTLPFELFVAEWIDPAAFTDSLNAANIAGVLFRPITIKPFYGSAQGKTLRGTHIHFTDLEKVNLLALQFRIVEVHQRLYPDRDLFALGGGGRSGSFDKAAGTDVIRKKFSKRWVYGDIEGYLNKDVEKFRGGSAKYHLYK